jgi:hypothetical protein
VICPVCQVDVERLPHLEEYCIEEVVKQRDAALLQMVVNIEALSDVCQHGIIALNCAHCGTDLVAAENAKLRAEVLDLRRVLGPYSTVEIALKAWANLLADNAELRVQLVAEDSFSVQAVELQKKLDAAVLQIDEMQKRIYKIGLLCDRVIGLEHGFCPDIGEPRDNITRIQIALERFIEKPKCGGCGAEITPQGHACGYWPPAVGGTSEKRKEGP